MIPAASYEEAIARIMKKGFDGVELDIYDVRRGKSFLKKASLKR